MDKETIKTYNLMAEAYDHETSSFWNKFPRTFIDKFRGSVEEGGLVLDVGSGPGRDGQILTQAGLKVICLDASHSMGMMTHKKGLLTLGGDFLKIPLQADTIKAVWTYTSLLHVSKDEVKTALIEINRILGHIGILGLGLIEGEGEYTNIKDGRKLPRHFALYTKSEIVRLLNSTGFQPFYFEEFKPNSRNYLMSISRKI